MIVKHSGGNRTFDYTIVTFGKNGEFANKRVELKGWLYRDGGWTIGGGGLPSPQNSEKPTFYFNIEDCGGEELMWWILSDNEIKALISEIIDGKSIYKTINEDELKARFPEIIGEYIYGILDTDESEEQLLGVIGKSVHYVSDPYWWRADGKYIYSLFEDGGDNQRLGIRNKATINELRDFMLFESKNGNSNYYLEEIHGYYGL